MSDVKRYMADVITCIDVTPAESIYVAEVILASDYATLEAENAKLRAGQEPVAGFDYSIKTYTTNTTTPQPSAVPDGWRQFVESCSLTRGCMVNGNRLSEMASRLLTVEHSAQWPTTPGLSARPSDDELWDQTLTERDSYHEAADKLTAAIAKHFEQDFGEHSNLNEPWSNALEFMSEIAASPSAPTVQGVNQQLLEVLEKIVQAPRRWYGRMVVSEEDEAQARAAIAAIAAARQEGGKV